MSHRDLRAYLENLERRGELVRISEPVQAEDALAAAANYLPNAVLFERVGDSGFGGLYHLFTTRDRCALALGVSDLEQLHVRLARLIDLNIPRGTTALVNRMGEYMDVFKMVAFPPPAPKPAPVQTVVHQQRIDLAILPFTSLDGTQIVWRQGGRSAADNSAQFVDSGRVKVIDSHTLALHVALEIGDADRVQVAVVLGGSPAAIWSAGAPLPGGIDRYFLAGWLRGRSMTFTRAVSQPLDVLADAECVIEGVIEGCERAADGSYTMQVTAITHRSASILPVIVPDLGDRQWMLKATERLFLPLLRLVINEVRDICLPTGGTEVVVVSARVRRRGDAQRIIYGLWGLIPDCRKVIVVDEHTDVHDADGVIARVMAKIEPERDIVYGMHPTGERVGIDGTGKN